MNIGVIEFQMPVVRSLLKGGWRGAFRGVRECWEFVRAIWWACCGVIKWGWLLACARSVRGRGFLACRSCGACWTCECPCSVSCVSVM